MSEVKKRECAGVYANAAFICIQTWSGYRSSMIDPMGRQLLFSPSAGEFDLGSAILDALACSRFVTPQEDPSLFDYRLVMERYKEWVASLQSAYGIKTKRALFKHMDSCTIERQEGSIHIIPRTHEKLETWTSAGIDPEDHVIVSAASSPNKLGAALRSALSRCL